ncbi:MAG: response regulator transcription factor [Clostridiales bacterium]|jgi:DNA-binding response OmpR family regulator|nr:response regulator transcription factor [Clostridiales bacterium]
MDMPILVVEDDARINGLICETLTGAGAGYCPCGVFSGSEALLALNAQPWKCVILDLMLPGKPGAEVLAAIRACGRMPVIVLSAKSDKESKLELLSLGADDYMTKPFDTDEMAARVAAQLRRFTVYSGNGMEKTKTLRYLDIEMDAEKRAVTVGGAGAGLTRREFDILELMLRYPQKVFSRANIFESVWSEDFLGDEKTINVHVGNLRAKLSALSPHKHIKTVWGVGFRLAE